MEFELWMIGRKVVEVPTGDIGKVTGPCTKDSSAAWVEWTSGSHAGHVLWIDLDKVRFLDETDSSTNEDILEKLSQIEKLVSEIYEALKGA